MRFRGRPIFLFLGIAVLLSSLSQPVLAATTAGTDNNPTFNLTTSPLPIELNTTPGGSVSTGLRIQNSGTKSIRLKVSLLKFGAKGDNGTPSLEKRGPADDYFDWVKFSQNNFVADPGVWNTITMTVDVPMSGAFGYYYAVVFSEISANGQAVSTKANVKGATATLVLLDVHAPGEKRQANLLSFTADKKLYEYLPTTFKVKVHNSGNTHVVPSGSVFISRDGIHDIAVLDVNKTGGNVLPSSNRVFDTSWSDGFPQFATVRDNGQIVSDKKGIPIEKLQWNFAKANKFRFGHYQAHLLLTYDNGSSDIPIDAVVSFWVIPWKILPIIILVVLLLGIGLWSSGKSLYRRIRRKSKNSK